MTCRQTVLAQIEVSGVLSEITHYFLLYCKPKKQSQQNEDSRPQGEEHSLLTLLSIVGSLFPAPIITAMEEVTQ